MEPKQTDTLKMAMDAFDKGLQNASPRYILTLSDGTIVPLTGSNASVRARQEIEVRIAAAFIDSALAAGYHISVDNGGDENELSDSTDKRNILAAMFLTDEETLWLDRPSDMKISYVKFVYGNDGWDVISDYTVDLEPLMKGEVKRLQDYYGG